MDYNRRQGQQAVVLPSPSDIGALAIRSVKTFARRHTVISGSYVLGLLVLIFFTTGTKLTLDQRHEYNQIMNTIDLHAEYEASTRYEMAMGAYRASKGWFTCDSLCQRNKQRMENARATLEEVRADGNARMSDAKKVAGLYSEVGVEETRDLFWDYFAKGKRFAKRQSMWDAMFMGLRSMSRDESMIEYVLKILFQVLLNFSLGLIAAFFVFIIGLWGIIKSYQPDPLTAVAFFICAVCAGFAFVSTYLFAIYGAAAGGLYGVAKLVDASMRIEGGQPRQFQNRPHYH